MQKYTEAKVNKLVINEIESELANLKRTHQQLLKETGKGETMKTAASLAKAGGTSELFKSGPQ